MSAGNVAEALERGPMWPVLVDVAALDGLEYLRRGRLLRVRPDAWHPIDLAAATRPPWEAARRLLEEP